MVANELEKLQITSIDGDDEYNIPLCVDDIINVCREFSNLGYKIQNQIESILETGVEEAIKTNIVNKSSLPHIKKFLKAISNNPYFGDAAEEAHRGIDLIVEYEDRHKISYACSTAN